MKFATNFCQSITSNAYRGLPESGGIPTRISPPLPDFLGSNSLKCQSGFKTAWRSDDSQAFADYRISLSRYYRCKFWGNILNRSAAQSVTAYSLESCRNITTASLKVRGTSARGFEICATPWPYPEYERAMIQC